MSDKLLAGHAPFSTYQRSTAELIVALLWDLTFALAMSLETATRGTMIAAMMPRIVTRAFFSLQLKARGRTEPANADAFMVFHAQIHMFGNAPSVCRLCRRRDSPGNQPSIHAQSNVKKV
jgi:hypothetical protein